MTGDWENSVSYAAVAFQGRWEKTVPMAEERLTTADKQALLKLARGVIETYLKTGKKPTPEALQIEVSDRMRQKYGAFVTLHKAGQLRGCIGEIIPHRALWQAVQERAISSAVDDPRFDPVDLSEVADLDIEISALSQPVPVKSYRDIQIGKHGIVLMKGGHSAVFLPQVPIEQHWDLATTLQYLSAKAGLPADGWKQDCEFEVFEAIVFGEKEQGLR